MYVKWRHFYYISLFTVYAFAEPLPPPWHSTYFMDGPYCHFQYLYALHKINFFSYYDFHFHDITFEGELNTKVYNLSMAI